MKLEMHVEVQDTRIQAQEEEIQRLKQMVEEMRNLQGFGGRPASAQSGVAQQSTSVDHIPASGADGGARADDAGANEERAEDP